ncbi:NfeD family protein [Alloalcanivorax profundimaris]|uniref:NfeD family protein n=1 Tax=Alloalcanivorax profundimaris TaxID=2735259 RepID=UPI001887E2A9|nr:NfeD family protein [Alloalcanivorax profundimaris]MBF1803284.1 NfeD family protein [Alloalcanivorax profundimaris]MCQ6260350.1 NfeD family protein [Alcanivorax sp. MM125-6]
MPEYSYWIILGLVLVIAEFAISGLVTIFLGLAALLVGTLVWLGLIDSLVWETTLFAVLSLVLLVVARRYLRERLFGRETQGATSEDSAGLVGARATVQGGFENGVGTVRYRGALWQAQSSHPLNDGQMVRILRHEGLWLTVAPWSSED